MKTNEYTIKARNLLDGVIVDGLFKGEDVNLVDIISINCGWNPLTKDEEMTVHFNGKEYIIKRTK